MDLIGGLVSAPAVPAKFCRGPVVRTDALILGEIQIPPRGGTLIVSRPTTTMDEPTTSTLGNPREAKTRARFSVWPSDEAMRHICKSAERVIVAAFTTKNTIPFGLLVALCCLIYKLPGAAIANLLFHLIDSRWFAVLGWTAFAVTLVVGWRIFCWRERLHVAELEQIIKMRDRLVDEQLKLKFESGPLKLEDVQK